MTGKSTERSRRLRQSLAAESFAEVRGIHAKIEDHEAIKQMIRDNFAQSLPVKKVVTPKSSGPKSITYTVTIDKRSTNVRVPNEIVKKIDRDLFAIDKAVVKIFGKDAYWSPEPLWGQPVRRGHVMRMNSSDRVTPTVTVFVDIKEGAASKKSEKADRT